LKTCDELVAAVRNDSRNQDVPDGSTSTIGIETADIVRYLNYGLERLQAIILKANPGIFRATYDFNTVAGQEAYTIPDRIYAQERIVNVQCSITGQVRDLFDLPERGISYRKSYPASYPTWYIRSGAGQIYLNGVPENSIPLIRVTYERQVDSININNGVVSGTPTGTSIVLSSPTSAQEALFATNTFICISDFEGNVMLRNGRIASYNAGSDTITLVANVSTYLVGTYTLANLASGVVTIGKYSTTHAKVADDCARYLELYGATKIFGRDSSSDGNELGEVEREILQTYQDNTKDEASVQITNRELIEVGDW
jgi:hypothetical protein